MITIAWEWFALFLWIAANAGTAFGWYRGLKDGKEMGRLEEKLDRLERIAREGDEWKGDQT